MKHISKTPIPDFFVSETNGLTNWSEYLAENKRKLKNYILQNEQFELCCYCESNIGSSSEHHLEHVIPKNSNNSLIFDYNNILVSCNGKHFNEISDDSVSNCGHRKNMYYDQNLFLNPILIPELEKYFKFDKDKGLIKTSDIFKQESTYTILLLNLNGNNDSLAQARIIAKNALLKILSKIPEEGKKIEMLKYLLLQNNLAFITFIRYCFKT